MLRVTQALIGAMMTFTLASPLAAQPAARRDDFFWLGEINKASTVINAEEGLLDPALAPRIAAGLDAVLRAGDQPGGERPNLVITFEPLLIEAAGVGATLLLTRNRATSGGPQPAEMTRMLRAAAGRLGAQEQSIAKRRSRIDTALTSLDGDFGKILARSRNSP